MHALSGNDVKEQRHAGQSFLTTSEKEGEKGKA